MRSIVLAALLAALGAACGGDGGGAGGGSESGGPGGDATPQTPLPAELVGTWSISSSGATIQARSALELAAPGTYALSTRIESSTCFFARETGTVEVDGDALTLHPRTLANTTSCELDPTLEQREPPAPTRYTWEVFHDEEWDLTYLRLDDGQSQEEWMKEE